MNLLTEGLVQAFQETFSTHGIPWPWVQWVCSLLHDEQLLFILHRCLFLLEQVIMVRMNSRMPSISRDCNDHQVPTPLPWAAVHLLHATVGFIDTDYRETTVHLNYGKCYLHAVGWWWKKATEPTLGQEVNCFNSFYFGFGRICCQVVTTSQLKHVSRT